MRIEEMESTEQRLRLRVTGVVQGVGFRPFVHRLATGLGLAGLVGNDAGAVFVEVQGPAGRVDEFTRRLRAECPPLARVDDVDEQPVEPTGDRGFAIVASDAAPSGLRTLVPPDVATCDACLAELFDPADRRYRHPFITCTDCGPRFTIVVDLPYDRPATTMAGFAMCPACAVEYHDPAYRRYHAQPVACPDCGPVLAWFRVGEPEGRLVGDAALAAAQRALADGLVVAVKGIGGYHLACRADDAAAVTRLRGRKQRGDKPFAVLVRDVAVARRLVRLDADQEAVLASPARPIVLADRRSGDGGADPGVVEEVAPGNPQLGVLLPYSPVHHLLLAPVPGGPAQVPDALVLTSANLTDEPLVFNDADAATRLPLLADAVLGHDRQVHVPCDDSVVRVLDGREVPVRRSRGYAPLPVALPAALAGVLAVGAELKNTFCVTQGPHAFCSAHVGDMGSVETLRAFERAVGQLVALVGGPSAAPELVAADLHPSYLTGRWAQRYCDARGLPDPVGVQHHHAHVVSLLAEHGAVGRPVIGIAFDGTG
jgi:hydrogenase maturation protein HypF